MSECTGFDFAIAFEHTRLPGSLFATSLGIYDTSPGCRVERHGCCGSNQFHIVLGEVPDLLFELVHVWVSICA